MPCCRPITMCPLFKPSVVPAKDQPSRSMPAPTEMDKSPADPGFKSSRIWLIMLLFVPIILMVISAGDFISSHVVSNQAGAMDRQCSNGWLTGLTLHVVIEHIGLNHQYISDSQLSQTGTPGSNTSDPYNYTHIFSAMCQLSSEMLNLEPCLKNSMNHLKIDSAAELTTFNTSTLGDYDKDLLSVLQSFVSDRSLPHVGTLRTCLLLYIQELKSSDKHKVISDFLTSCDNYLIGIHALFLNSTKNILHSTSTYITCMLHNNDIIDPSICYTDYQNKISEILTRDIHDNSDRWIVVSATLLCLCVVTTMSPALLGWRSISKEEKGTIVKHDVISGRIERLEADNERTESLVYQMLPATIADKLLVGRTVDAEHFDQVSIFFSCIEGFTEVTLSSSPMVVVDLLNALYGTFDDCVDQYRVYKVETIGDSYLVGSGVPNRIGDEHAAELASLALHMMKESAQHSLPGSSSPLPLRIGLNSGAIVSGVIGLKNPRYCLFGDAVNTASRMMSTGTEYKIHASDNFREAAVLHGKFNFETRGSIKVKGKGYMTTHWLAGKE